MVWEGRVSGQHYWRVGILRSVCDIFKYVILTKSVLKIPKRAWGNAPFICALLHKLIASSLMFPNLFSRLLLLDNNNSSERHSGQGTWSWNAKLQYSGDRFSTTIVIRAQENIEDSASVRWWLKTSAMVYVSFIYTISNNCNVAIVVARGCMLSRHWSTLFARSHQHIHRRLAMIRQRWCGMTSKSIFSIPYGQIIAWYHQ